MTDDWLSAGGVGPAGQIAEELQQLRVADVAPGVDRALGPEDHQHRRVHADVRHVSVPEAAHHLPPALVELGEPLAVRDGGADHLTAVVERALADAHGQRAACVSAQRAVDSAWACAHQARYLLDLAAPCDDWFCIHDLCTFIASSDSEDGAIFAINFEIR